MDVSRPKDIREFLEVGGWWRPAEGECYVPPSLDDLLPDVLQENYFEWEFVIHDAPTAQAFEYLERLPLADRDARGQGLWQLEFEEGTHPGDNSSLVSTKRVETLGGLHARLLELGEHVELVVTRV